LKGTNKFGSWDAHIITQFSEVQGKLCPVSSRKRFTHTVQGVAPYKNVFCEFQGKVTPERQILTTINKQIYRLNLAVGSFLCLNINETVQKGRSFFACMSGN
jgi:hypothetical protein